MMLEGSGQQGVPAGEGAARNPPNMRSASPFHARSASIKKPETRSGGALAKLISVFQGLRDRFQYLSLALQFVLVAFAFLAIAMTTLGYWVSSQIEAGVVRNTASSSALYLMSVLEPAMDPVYREKTLTPNDIAALDRIVQSAPLSARTESIKIWDRGGTIIYSSDKKLIGKHYPESKGLQSALQGTIYAEFDDLDDEENEFDRLSNRPLLEVYAPIFARGTDRVVGSGEIYLYSDELSNNIARIRRSTVLFVTAFTVAVLTALYLIVRQGSRTIDRQRAALEERIAELGILLEQNEGLRQNVIQARKLAAETNERLFRRIGADLHDGPSQHVSLALLLLDQIDPRRDDERKEQIKAFQTVRGVLSDCLSELRTLSAGIAPPELQDLALDAVIELAIKNHEKRTGTSVARFIASSDRAISITIRTALYRFTQEGLTNAFRHAGGRGQRVTASATGDVICVEVSDDGPGMAFDFKPRHDALGLAGLRDRIESLGGQFEIRTAPGRGTKIMASFVIGGDPQSNV